METEEERVAREKLEAIGHIEIPLAGSLGKGKVVLVDDDYDGEWVSKYSWYLGKHGYAYRRVSRFEYAELSPDGKFLSGPYKNIPVYLHRVLMGNAFDPINSKKNQLWVDHVNRNKLDNRSCNLRLITPSESAKNRTQGTHRKRDPNSIGYSKYRGVTREYYEHDGNYIHLDTWRVRIEGAESARFDNEKAAALAYNEIAKAKYGEDATLNDV